MTTFDVPTPTPAPAPSVAPPALSPRPEQLQPSSLPGRVALLVLWHRSALVGCSQLVAMNDHTDDTGWGPAFVMVADRPLVALSSGERRLWEAAEALCIRENVFDPAIVAAMDAAQPSDLDALRRAVRAWCASSDLHDVIRDVL